MPSNSKVGIKHSYWNGYSSNLGGANSSLNSAIRNNSATRDIDRTVNELISWIPGAEIAELSNAFDSYKEGDYWGAGFSTLGAIPIVGKLGKLGGKLGKKLFEKAGVKFGKSAHIGTKLEYVFGKATGNAHNIERSTEMLRKLQSIGIFDNKAGRSLMKSHLESIYSSTKGILQSNGRYLRESILMGPNGGVKVESVWEGNKLITVKLLGGK